MTYDHMETRQTANTQTQANFESTSTQVDDLCLGIHKSEQNLAELDAKNERLVLGCVDMFEQGSSLSRATS